MFDETRARARRAARPADVELVSMPWTALTEPSLGLGILSAILERSAFACRVRHLNLSLLRYLRPGTYAALADSFALNDFLFTGGMDPVVTTRQWGWLRAKTAAMVLSGRLDDDSGERPPVDDVVERLLELRSAGLPRWLDEQAGRLAASPAPLIGFTCMFDQTIASVALARLVKERAPEKLIALGGYAVRPPTGETVLDAFPWIDAVCVGEGEATIVELARAAAGDLDLARVPGIAHRDGGRIPMTAPPPTTDLAASPTPDFDDYYLDVADLSAGDLVDITPTRLPVENSRGCWWGQIRHCVFCGIHDDDLRYRIKPAEVALRTMDDLAARYGVGAFRFSDYILPRSYFDTLLPRLASRGAPYRLSAEMKANVSPADFTLLAAAGFREVQPGIESFSTAALDAMDKGTSAIRNAQTLLLGKTTGVQVHWNLLYGFPGDDPDDYERMLGTLERLIHLDPPATCLPVQVTRFAPLQSDPARFKIPHAVYEPGYDLVFSADYLARTGFDLGKYCYYFMRPFENSVRLNGIYRRIDALVERWRAAGRCRAVTLEWRLESGRTVVTDTRDDPAGVVLELDEAQGELLRALTVPRTVTGLARHGLRHTPAETAESLAGLDRLGLVLRDGERWLSLVLPADRPAAGRTDSTASASSSRHGTPGGAPVAAAAGRTAPVRVTR
ncbi:RiPP maturation radical SAM C-methyltransferase [Rhizohabitans arisaemae]|uniref:RiPP maturation radical SAM C-methyltransferase n=1 Tax=Rhizohabitans arisaemae TaxID=2720610 RepID=UPI0024B26B27|nr:RiPP maturation radical SAM C-methyltransferase [Rhizohabitans arisaemae]